MTEFAVLLWALAILGMGMVFGAVVGALNWRRGHPVGTGLGLAVIRAVNRVLDARLSPTVTGAVVGGIDSLLLTGTLLSVALLIEPSRELLFTEEFRLESLRILGLLAIGAASFSTLAWILLHATASRILEVVVGLGCIVGLGALVAHYLKWPEPWTYGVGAGVLTLVLFYVVFPERPPPAPSPPEPPDEGILEFKRPLPPDDRIQPEK